MDGYPRFSDFAKDEKRLDGDKMRIEEALNLEILIIGHKIRDSRYGGNGAGNPKYLSLQIQYEDKKYVIFTGSKILLDQIDKYADKIPFLATIIKVDRYYSLS